MSDRSTQVKYYYNVRNHVIPLLGGLDISKITPNLIQEYINKLNQDGFASKTINDILMIIKNIFKFADCKGIKHYCDLSIITLKIKKPEIETLTLFEQQKLCNYLTEKQV